MKIREKETSKTYGADSLFAEKKIDHKTSMPKGAAYGLVERVGKYDAQRNGQIHTDRILPQLLGHWFDWKLRHSTGAFAWDGELGWELFDLLVFTNMR